jgi:hypothetical protein
VDAATDGGLVVETGRRRGAEGSEHALDALVECVPGADAQLIDDGLATSEMEVRQPDRDARERGEASEGQACEAFAPDHVPGKVEEARLGRIGGHAPRRAGDGHGRRGGAGALGRGFRSWRRLGHGPEHRSLNDVHLVPWWYARQA